MSSHLTYVEFHKWSHLYSPVSFRASSYMMGQNKRESGNVNIKTESRFGDSSRRATRANWRQVLWPFWCTLRLFRPVGRRGAKGAFATPPPPPQAPEVHFLLITTDLKQSELTIFFNFFRYLCSKLESQMLFYPLLIHRLLLEILSLRSKVCFGGFVVRIKQMFSCRFSFTGRSCGLLLFSRCLWFLIFAPSSIRLVEGVRFPFFF